jgi:2-aminoadipate transaminase
LTPPGIGQKWHIVAILHVPLDRGKPVALAKQIQDHLERLIRDGHLGDGVKLPATRELAKSLGVNRATVALAYEEMIAGGRARAHVGQGTFVVGSAPAPRPAEPRSRTPINWTGLLSRSARVVAAEEDRWRRMGPGDVERVAVSFAGGMPDSELFPTEAFRQVLNRVLRDEGDVLLQYHSARGYPPLRQYLARYLLRFGVEATPDEILIVNGSQQGFDLVARTFVDAGDFVAVEQPTYPRALQVFRAAGAQLLAVPWAREGPRPDVLERLLERHRPKLFYCQPNCHNPTGLSMTAETGRRLLALAARNEVPIVEDGFDPTLYYGRRPATPLKALDGDGVVIYIGTFSKVLFPGLRLGWVVAAAPVIERLLAAKQLADLHTSALLQAAVQRFGERRLLDRHASRAAAEYGQRRTMLVEALRRRMPEGTTWTEAEGGFSLLVTLPAGMDAVTLLPAAVARGVAFTPGRPFFVEGGERTFRLSFSAVPARRIDDGVRRLAETIKAAMKRPRVSTTDRAAVPVV